MLIPTNRNEERAGAHTVLLTPNAESVTDTPEATQTLPGATTHRHATNPRTRY